MRSRVFSFLGVVALATTTLQGLPALAQETFTVRDSWTVSGLQAGWFWAEEKGYFAKAGIKVVHEDGNGSTTTVQLVGAGQFDVGHGDLSVMAIARGKGVPLKAIGGLIQKTSLGVFVSQGSGLKTPKDLEGKEVIYTSTSFEAPFLDAFLSAGGTTREKVKLISVDASAKISTYVAGRGDGMITSIPFGLPFLKKRPSDYILFADYDLAIPSYGLLVREDTLSKRRDGLAKLSAAFYRAWTEIVDGGAAAAGEAADIIIKRRPDAKLDRSVVIDTIVEHIKYFRTPNTASKPLGVQTSEDWTRTIASLEGAKLVPAGSKPADYFTNELFGEPAK